MCPCVYTCYLHTYTRSIYIYTHVFVCTQACVYMQTTSHILTLLCIRETFICICTCSCAFKCVHIDPYPLSIHTHIHINIFNIFKHACRDMHISRCIYVYTQTHTPDMYTHVYSSMCIYQCIHAYVHMHIYVYICVYIYICEYSFINVYTCQPHRFA